MLYSIKKLYIPNTMLRVIVNYVGNMMQLIVVDLTRALLQNVVQNYESFENIFLHYRVSQ